MSSDSIFDIDYPRALFYALFVLLGVAVIYAGSTSGTAFGAYNDRWDGSATLRSQAADLDAEVTIVRNASAYNDVPANGTVAYILAPTANYSDRDIVALRTFVRNGGSLVVADDATQPSVGNRLLSDLGGSARFENATLRDERHNYRGPALPIAQNVTNSSVTRDVDSLTLNYGTAIEPANATVLVRTSGYAYLDRDGSESITGNESLARYPVVTREEYGNGSIIAVSDPSIFINSMLERPGNERFAQALISPHDRVLLDYSHSTSLPPLVSGLLTLRDSSLLQVLFGVCGLVAIVGWRRGTLSRAVSTLRGLFADTESRDIDRLPSATAEEIAAYLEDQHPDWDPERAKRLADTMARDEGDRHEDQRS